MSHTDALVCVERRHCHPVGMCPPRWAVTPSNHLIVPTVTEDEEESNR